MLTSIYSSAISWYSLNSLWRGIVAIIGESKLVFMKTLLLIVALIGFTAVGSYAQNKNCNYKHKMHQKAAATTEDNTIHTTLLLAPVKEDPPCVTYKNDNLSITACPGVSDNNGLVEYTIEGTYMGNYPVVCTPRKAADGSLVLACEPKCTPMENRETEAPIYNPMCFYDCPGR
jgi:hypothetical protein